MKEDLLMQMLKKSEIYQLSFLWGKIQTIYTPGGSISDISGSILKRKEEKSVYT